ncbi:MAG: M48 family metallopeptidase [Hyphomicrobiales bacterium]|nr:M48 family metallopeptidase [Hyphomicrobiales bacterium]
MTQTGRRWRGRLGPSLRRHTTVAMMALAAGLAAMPTARADRLSFIRDTEIERLLADYSRPIFRAAGLGGQNIAMRIVKHETFNAFVLDGQNVFMHTGALMQSDTPNQVIGIIAHETGHITGGHLAQLRDRIARDQTKSLLIKLLGIGLMVAGGGGGVSGAGSGMLAAGDQMLIRSLLADRRAQESSADQSALRFLEATKQSGQGMLATFERFAQQEYISASGTTQDAFARSHPVAVERLAQLRQRVAASPHANQKDPPELQLRHDLMRAKIAGYLERPQIVMNRYRSSDQSLPARYARAIATFFGKGIDAGLPEAEKLIRENPQNAYFHELKADFLMRSGRAREAIAPLRTALKLAGDAPLMTVRLAQALDGEQDARSVQEAIALVRRSLITDKNPQGYRILASGYAKQGRVAEADLAIAEAHFLEGNVKQAQIFAKRSQRGLKNGSPEGLRAGDIVSYKLPTGAL